MKNAVSSNWVAETCVATDSGFTLKGTSKGYTRFSDAFKAGDQVFYSVHDSDGNREAGYATFDGTSLVDREPTATLYNNVYTKSSVSKLNFSGELTIACTFNAVAFNVLWKALDAIDPDGDGSINIPPELIDGLIDKLDTKAEQADLEQEIQDRIDGDKALQDQIDALDPDGDRKVDWSEIDGKPSEFPPAAHDQGWDTITDKPADYPPSSHGHGWGEITGKPSEFPPADHNHDGDYLKTETDPTVPDHVKAITTDDIDNWNASGSGASSWDELTGKPTEFPPEAHTQGWDTITGKPADFPPSAHGHAWDDVTGKPTEFPPEAHTHGQDEVDGLELRLEAIEDSITSGGGFVDAPNDGKLYGRQSEAWAEVVIPDGGASSWNDLTDKPAEFPPSDHTHEIDDVNGLQDALNAAGGAPAWDDVTGKPTEFPPAAHNHDGVYQPVGDYIGEAPNDGEEYARKNQSWVKLQDHNYTGADAVKLTGDQSVAGHKTWTGIATFGDTVTMRGILNGDVSANFGGPVTATSLVKAGGTSSEYLMADGSVSSGPTGEDGGGEFVHIGEAPPADPQEGQQWMEVPADGDATMWVYDGGKWLQHPGGKDGADGADGISVWEQSGDDIYYSDGNVGIGTDSPTNTLVVSDGSDGLEFRTSLTDDNRILSYNRGTSAYTKMSFDAADYDFRLGGGPSSFTIDKNGKATFAGQIISDFGSSYTKMILKEGGTNTNFVQTATDFSIWPNNESSKGFSLSNVTGNATFSGAVLVGGGTDVGSQTNSGVRVSSGAQVSKVTIQSTDASGANNTVFSALKGTKETAFISASGDATFSGSVNAAGLVVNGNIIYNNSASGHGIRFNTLAENILPINNTGSLTTDVTDIGGSANKFKNGYFSGSVTSTRMIADGHLVMSTRDLIETLSTLRNATKDETTLEGLRDAIGNAVGGLVEKFEAMQSAATQEIES